MLYGLTFSKSISFSKAINIILAWGRSVLLHRKKTSWSHEN